MRLSEIIKGGIKVPRHESRVGEKNQKTDDWP